MAKCCFLCGTDWICKYSVDELWLQRVKDNKHGNGWNVELTFHYHLHHEDVLMWVKSGVGVSKAKVQDFFSHKHEVQIIVWTGFEDLTAVKMWILVCGYQRWWSCTRLQDYTASQRRWTQSRNTWHCNNDLTLSEHEYRGRMRVCLICVVLCRKKPIMTDPLPSRLNEVQIETFTPLTKIADGDWQRKKQKQYNLWLCSGTKSNEYVSLTFLVPILKYRICACISRT
jgi:hypothetical protein